MLILLDIDGVLVPANSWKKPEFLTDGFPVFSLKAVTALKRILAETNAPVLLTTSHKTKYNLSQWRSIFSAREIDLQGLDRLTTDSLLTSRKDEILQWYAEKPVTDEPFVIIDDDKMLNDLPSNLKSKLVLTSPSIGLTNELADEAIAILGRQT